MREKIQFTIGMIVFVLALGMESAWDEWSKDHRDIANMVEGWFAFVFFVALFYGIWRLCRFLMNVIDDK